ncbi:hypothetical protein PG984_008386 [Apiospora sp. TS-2023a]
MTMNIHKHHDAFGRLLEIPLSEYDEEMYLEPYSGKLVPLVVQQATKPTLRPVGVISLSARLSQWVHAFSLAPYLDPIPSLYRATIQALEYGGNQGTGRWRKSGRLRSQISPIITLAQWADSSPWAWVPSCFFLLFVLLIPHDVGGTLRNDGDYDPIYAYDRQYAKVARNRKEDYQEREDDETTGLISQIPEDGEMSCMTAYTSTTSLVSKVPQKHQNIEMTYWTPNTYPNPARSTTWGSRQGATELPPITRHSTTTSQASTAHGSFTAEVEEPDDEKLMKRGFGPTHLCFLEYDNNGNPIGYDTHNVIDWVRLHGGHAETDYVFLSYTRAQFGVFTEDWLNEKKITDIQERENLLRMGEFNRATLVRYGMEAAYQAGLFFFFFFFFDSCQVAPAEAKDSQRAGYLKIYKLKNGLKAFWWDFECILNTDGSTAANVNNPEVYSICEVARAAHSMVVLVGPSEKPHPMRPYSEEAYGEWLDECGKMYNAAAFTEWMQVWGSRMWTFPEILLVPSQRPVKVYAIGGSRPPEQWEKRNFAARNVWKDANRVRQLIDHYESSIHLEPLELLSIALECFHNRDQGTDRRFQGDPAYALMSLLRRRPAMDTTDSEFAAFARLSLANNSEAFLERLICVQLLETNKPWHYQHDFWGSKLWDIEPKCQIAGIADDETVILDGAYGATIQWNAMEPVPFLVRPTWRRTLGKWLLRGSTLDLAVTLVFALYAAAIVVYTADVKRHKADIDDERTQIWVLLISIFFLFVATGISLAAPAMILNLYVGKFWDTQASFVGMEGVPSDLGMIEEYLFGSNRGRLQWSVAGSALSRHKKSTSGSEQGACVGLPPLLRSGHDDSGTMHTFTVVDTFSMTAMAFRAARPPTAVIVCGREGGMQRAALCSYDWKHNTFSREQVIRLTTAVLDRMSRMDRFRFSFKRRCGALASTEQTKP